MFYGFCWVSRFGGPPWLQDERPLAETMATYWTNFAKSGNPNIPRNDTWAANQLKQRCTKISKITLPMKFDLPSTKVTCQGTFEDDCPFPRVGIC